MCPNGFSLDEKSELCIQNPLPTEEQEKEVENPET